MIKLPSLTQIKDQLKVTAQRFPLPTACAAIITVLGILLTHNTFSGTQEEVVTRILMVAVLGILSLSALTLACENLAKNYRQSAMIVGVTLLALYGWTLPADLGQDGSMWMMRQGFLMLGSVVALSWIVYWKNTVDNNILWRWCSDLIGNLVVTGFFAIVLFLGIAAALWSIDMLFGADIDEKLYLDVWIIIAALFSPLFFLAQLDKSPLTLKAPKSVSGFMSVFTKYIMTPLSAGYLVILYAYTAKILITGEWPKGVLGWLVICFLGVAIFTYFLWTPLLKPSWEKYRRIFWLVLIPQILLLFVAIGWRIQAYSWTENRYFVVVLGLWLLGTTIYFLVKKNAKFKWVFVALTAIIFVSQIGPLSGYNIGKHAQTARLMTLLETAEIRQLHPDTLAGHPKTKYQFVPAKIEVNNEIENEIASILDYLKDRHGDFYVRDLFMEQVTDDTPSYDVVKTVMKSLELEYRNKWERNQSDQSSRSSYFYLNADHQAPRNINGYHWRVIPAYGKRNAGSHLKNYTFVRHTGKENLKVTVTQNDQVIETIELKSVLQKLATKQAFDSERRLDPEQMRYDYDSDTFKIRFYFISVSGEDEKVTNFDAEMYVRMK